MQLQRSLSPLGSSRAPLEAMIGCLIIINISFEPRPEQGKIHRLRPSAVKKATIAFL